MFYEENKRDHARRKKEGGHHRWFPVSDLLADPSLGGLVQRNPPEYLVVTVNKNADKILADDDDDDDNCEGANRIHSCIISCDQCHIDHKRASYVSNTGVCVLPEDANCSPLARRNTACSPKYYDALLSLADNWSKLKGIFCHTARISCMRHNYCHVRM